MSDLATKVMELIEEGKNVLGNQPVKPQIVMFLGITGAGKSSLINYISGVQLESFSENGGASYKLRAKDPSKEFAGIKIGHSSASCTIYPGIHSPFDKSFTYIDTPGFGDTGRLGNNNVSDSTQKTQRVTQDIANAYFRSAIIEKASELKIVLVVTHQDLDARPGTLPKSLRDLAHFIQSIESDNPAIVEKIKQSISIVVTKVEDTNIVKRERIREIADEIELNQASLVSANKSHDSTLVDKLQKALDRKELEKQTLQQEIEAFSSTQAVKTSLKNFINTSPELREFRNVLSILNFVVDNKRYTAFSTPKIACDKDLAEAAEIQNLIHNQTTFIAKQDANIAIQVSDENSKEVMNTINGLSFMANDLAKSIDKDISKKIKTAFKSGKDDKFQAIKIDVETGKDYSIPCALQAFFEDLQQGLNFSKETINKYEEFNKLLTLLVGLLPETDRANYLDKKNWVVELGLHAIFDEHIKKIQEILKMAFVKNIDKDITQKLKNAFNKTNEEKIKVVKNKCETVKTYTSSRTLETFFYDVNKTLKLSSETIKEFEAFNKFHTFLVDVLPEIVRENYLNKINWIEELELDSIIDIHIKDAADILSEPVVKFDNGKLTIQGYYVKTSQVDEIIKNHRDITSVDIHASQTINIDSDLTDKNPNCVDKLHGVNISLIAPKIVVSGNRTIDLSGKAGIAHAGSAADGSGHNANWDGISGADGQPGKPGCSSGNLFIACNQFIDSKNLAVFLNGGKGGAGQRGGNGGTGRHGKPWDPNIPGGWYPIEERHEIGDRTSLQKHKHNGEVGGNGGNAGNGGAGGTGGKAGTYAILELACNSINTVNVINNFGSKGEQGKAGSPGAGGNYGADAYRTYRWFHNGEKWDDDSYNQSNGKTGYAGSSGKDGANTNGLQDAKTVVYNASLSLLNYKIFLAQKAIEYPTVMGEFLHGFGKHCASIKATELKTTTKDLLEEANALEKYSLELGKTIDFAPFYYSLLARVQEFALDPVRTPGETKVLEYLYVSTLGSIARLKAADDNLLVINIHQYVKNLVDKDFADLKTIKADQLKQYYTKQYQEGIEHKIKEAQSYLEILNQDIHSRQQAIDPQIRKLTQEVNNIIIDKTKEKSALQEKRRELEAALYKKAVFGIMSIAVQGVGMAFPPAGPIVAGVVNAGLTMAANPSIDTATNFANKVVDMKSQLGKLSTGTTNEYEVELFKKMQEMAKTVAPLIENARDLLSQQHEGDARLQQLDNQITSVNDYITELDTYLKTVPQSLGKYLEGMVSEVQSFQTALQDKSLVGLDFSKLEIKRFFASMKQNIKALTGQFEASDGFEDIVNKMEEAMDVSLNISSRVQDYCEHIAFANFIAHLHSANVQNVVVSAEYQQAVDELKVKLQSSIVQEAYYRAIAAAKQWAFPFAEKFLSAIPKFDTTDELIMEDNLKALLRRLDDYKTCITDMDQAVTLGRFNTVAPNIPFFTWSYEHNPQKIEALLKGEKVILSADVVQSKVDAVKFNKIGISFTGMSDAKQAEFDALLQNNYKVSLEHSGTSYHKFFGNVYQLQNDKPLEISCSFKMRPDNTTPEHYTSAWDKMAKGDILLSPYTSWVVKIEPTPIATSAVNLFDKFNDVKDQIKVNLTGEGSYVDISRVNSNLNVDKYYPVAANQEPLAISHALARNGLFKAKKSNNNQASVEDGKNNTPQPKM